MYRSVSFLIISCLLFIRLLAQARDTLPGCALPEDEASLEGVKVVDFLVMQEDSLPDPCKILLDSFIKSANKVDPKQLSSLAYETCEVCKALHGAKSREYMNALGNAGVFNAQIGNYKEALRCLIEAGNVHQSQGWDKNNYDYARFGNFMGMTYFHIGNIQKSIEVLEETHHRLLEMKADTSITFANNCSYLGTIYGATGNFGRAFFLHSASEQYFIEKRDTLNTFFAANLANAGTLYFQFGDFKQAEHYIKRSISIFQRIGMSKTSFYQQVISTLAMIYARLSANERGIDLLEKDVQRLLETPSYILVNAVTLSTYSGLLIQSGQFEKADSINQIVLSILEENVGINSLFYLRILGNLSASYLRQNKIEEAIELSSKVIKELTEKNVNALPFYSVLIAGYEKQRKHENVRHIISQVLSSLIPGERLSDPGYFNFFAQGMPVLSNSFDTVLLRQCADFYFPSILHYIHYHFPLLTEKEKLQFLQYQLSQIQAGGVASLFYSQLKEDLQTGSDIYDIALSIKGILLEDVTRSCEAIIEDGDSTLRKDYFEWKGNRQLLLKQEGLAPNQRDQQEYPYSIDSLRRSTDDLEISIMSRSESLRQTLQTVTWKEIQDNLAPNEAAIEFVRIPPLSNRMLTPGSSIYVALVLRKEYSYPRLIELVEEDKLISVLESVASSYEGKFHHIYSGNEFRMFHLIWEPLEPFLEGVSIVYFAPEGLLHQVAYAGIGCPGSQLLSDRYILYQMGSTRDILSLKKTRDSSALKISEEIFTTLFVGGMDYNAPEDCLTNARYGEPGITPDLSRDRGAAGELYDLHNSSVEVSLLDSLFRRNRVKTKLLTGCAASEDNLRQELSKDTSPSILHISTHGINHIQIPLEKIPYLQSPQNNFPDNPLFYFSLAFSGYNSMRPSRNPMPGLSDGEIFAAEFRDFNLSGTELVTLSACMSSRGVTPASEGMFGLQRAFRLAGARHVIGTLYEVDDEATARFMVYFYRSLLSGVPIREAFRQAQLDMRADKKFHHPYYWAGFVLL